MPSAAHDPVGVEIEDVQNQVDRFGNPAKTAVHLGMFELRMTFQDFCKHNFQKAHLEICLECLNGRDFYMEILFGHGFCQASKQGRLLCRFQRHVEEVIADLDDKYVEKIRLGVRRAVEKTLLGKRFDGTVSGAVEASIKVCAVCNM